MHTIPRLKYGVVGKARRGPHPMGISWPSRGSRRFQPARGKRCRYLRGSRLRGNAFVRRTPTRTKPTSEKREGVGMEGRGREGKGRGAVVWVPGSDGACGSRNRSVEPVLGPVFRAVYARWIVDNGRKSCPPTLPLVSFFHRGGGRVIIRRRG